MGLAIWERLEAAIGERIKAAGGAERLLPAAERRGLLRREAEHVEGFSPELAVVSQAGGKELEEPAVVRPASKTIVNSAFARWISSNRDLPLLINQWANAVRWELRPRLFIRTSEFLWELEHAASELTADQTGLIVVGEPTLEKGFDEAVTRSAQIVKRSLDASEEIADELREALRASGRSPMANPTR